MKMKTFLFFLFVAMLPAIAAAQSGYVNVTATIPGYAGGQATATFQNQSSAPQLPLLNGSVFPTTAIGNLNINGTFTVTLADDLIIQPTPSQWQIILCSKTGNPSQPCYPVTLTITCVNNGLCVNGTLDISSYFANAPAPPSGNLPGATYAGQMLIATGPGGTYKAGTAQCSTVITDASHICITAPPYNAYGGFTTGTSGTFAAGSSGPVATCNGVIGGEGVIIGGAGAAGADYLGQVGGCSNGTLSVSPATSTSVPVGTMMIFGENATTTATWAPGATGAISSCGTFKAGQGVLIGAAGSGGSNYFGTVVSCLGTQLVVNPATQTSVSSGIAVQHDESAAFQAAVNAGAFTGVTVYIPDGWYALNGALQDTSHANAVIKFPNLNYGDVLLSPSPVIAFRGLSRPSTVTNSGTFLYSSIASGNIFAAYNPNSPAQFVGFTNFWVDFENITFRGPHNPGTVMMNLNNAVGARIDHVRCDTGTSGDSPLPTNTNSGCLYFPNLGNNVNLTGHDLTVAGWANGVWAYEHTDLDALYEANDINGLIADSGAQGGTAGHNTIHVGYWWCQVCTNMLAAGVNPATVQIDTMDIESIAGFGFNDPSNLLTGKINYLVPLSAFAVTPQNPSVNGASNLCLYNLSHPANSQNCGSSAGPGGIPISTTALADNWPSQEASGGTLLNTATSTNNATATAVTWAAANGFASKVANYNGTSSFAQAAVNNTYDGTAPFSACAWIVPANITAGTVYTIVGDTRAGATAGWRMDIYNQGGGTGAIQLYMINTPSTNLIQTRSPYGAITPSVINQACFTYDGSKNVSGVHINVNGADQTLTTAANSLTGSIAATTPVLIGAQNGGVQWFLGAIGRLRIFSRVLSTTEMQALYNAGPNVF